MNAQKEHSILSVAEITGDSWEKLAKDNYAEAERLEALNAELVAALEAFVKACDSAPPLELMTKISDACDKARAALSRAKG